MSLSLSSQYFNKTFRQKGERERKGQARQLEPSPQRLSEQAATAVSCGHMAGTGGNTHRLQVRKAGPWLQFLCWVTAPRRPRPLSPSALSLFLSGERNRAKHLVWNGPGPRGETTHRPWVMGGPLQEMNRTVCAEPGVLCIFSLMPQPSRLLLRESRRPSEWGGVDLTAQGAFLTAGRLRVFLR